MAKPDNPNKLPRGYFPIWSISGASSAVGMILLMQITYYATEVVGLPPALVGAILMGTKILDGATDLFAGFLVDRTNTRLGRGRPWHLFIILYWVSIILLLSTPNFGMAGKAVWVTVMYSMAMSISYTSLMASANSYMKRSLSGSERQGKVMAGSGAVIMFFGAASSIMLPQLMSRWGTLPGGWTRIALVYGIPMTVLGMLRFFFIKENVKDIEEDKQNPIGVIEGIKLMFSNKYAMLLAGASVCDNVAKFAVSAAAAYYFTYIIGDLGSMSLVAAFGIVTPLIFLLFPLAQRTIGAMNFVRINIIVAAVGYGLLFFAGNNLPMVLVCAVLGGVGSNCLAMIGGVFIIQTMDYGEWKTGKRVEGMLSSFNSFASKIGSGFASLIVGAVMALGGYVSGAETQTPAALMSIKFVYSITPFVFCILGLVVLHFFDVDKKIPQIQKDLEARKATA
ncbi:hypothetical protein AGMMS49991_10050 [Spirochaetia bacterium]|nr:hypothetical protein AGMMS49991_10050 [Spirochaetia bacterium]